MKKNNDNKIFLEFDCIYFVNTGFILKFSAQFLNSFIQLEQMIKAINFELASTGTPCVFIDNVDYLNKKVFFYLEFNSSVEISLDDLFEVLNIIFKGFKLDIPRIEKKQTVLFPVECFYLFGLKNNKKFLQLFFNKEDNLYFYIDSLIYKYLTPEIIYYLFNKGIISLQYIYIKMCKDNENYLKNIGLGLNIKKPCSDDYILELSEGDIKINSILPEQAKEYEKDVLASKSNILEFRNYMLKVAEEKTKTFEEDYKNKIASLSLTEEVPKIIDMRVDVVAFSNYQIDISLHFIYEGNLRKLIEMFSELYKKILLEYSVQIRVLILPNTTMGVILVQYSNEEGTSLKLLKSLLSVICFNIDTFKNLNIALPNKNFIWKVIDLNAIDSMFFWYKYNKKDYIFKIDSLEFSYLSPQIVNLIINNIKELDQLIEVTIDKDLKGFVQSMKLNVSPQKTYGLELDENTNLNYIPTDVFRSLYQKKVDMWVKTHESLLHTFEKVSPVYGAIATIFEENVSS